MTTTYERSQRSHLWLLYPVLPILGFGLWYASTSADDPTVPSPYGVWEAGQELVADGRLIGGLTTSLSRVIIGFALALVLGTVVGILMGRSRAVHVVVDPLIELARPIAPIALVPLAILWLGTGGASAVAIICYAAFFPIVLNVYSSVHRLDQSLVNAARTFGSGRLVILTQVILPGIVPGLIVGARLGMGLAWTAVIAAELAVIESDASATPGIGQLMMIFYQYQASPNPIVVCMVAIGVLGIVLDVAIRRAGVKSTPWLKG